MSWWPFSGASANTGAKAQTSQASSISQPSATAPQTQHASAPASTALPTPPAGAPHEPDFYAAHPHLAPPSFPSNSAAPQPATTSPPEANDELDPSLPQHMSCRAAFDSAFYCSSFGGHFNDIYRYGQLRSCSEHWSDFWFCMRTKNSYSSAHVKQRIIQDRYREKEKKLMEGPNCEDVWERRKPGEEDGGAFAIKEGD